MAHFVAALGWSSVFALTWLRVLEVQTAGEGITFAAYLLFFAVALIATIAVGASDRRNKLEKRE